MQDIGKLLKATMVEKRCNATCALLYVSKQTNTEAQKPLQNKKKN